MAWKDRAERGKLLRGSAKSAFQDKWQIWLRNDGRRSSCLGGTGLRIGCPPPPPASRRHLRMPPGHRSGRGLVLHMIYQTTTQQVISSKLWRSDRGKGDLTEEKAILQTKSPSYRQKCDLLNKKAILQIKRRSYRWLYGHKFNNIDKKAILQKKGGHTDERQSCRQKAIL